MSDTKSPLTANAPVMYLSPAALSSDATCADTSTLGHQSAAGATHFQEKAREAWPPARFRMKLPQTDNHHWGDYRVPAPSSCLRRARTSTEPQMLAGPRWGSNLTRRIASRPQRLPLAPARAQLGLEPVPPDCRPAQVGRSSWGSNLGRRIASQPRGQEGGGKRKPFTYIERIFILTLLFLFK